MNEMDMFLDAINNMPDDIHRAKFDGIVEEKHQRNNNGSGAVFNVTADLHGMKKHEALKVLEIILKRAQGKGQHILLITGRGNNSEDGIAVIREAVRYYLDRDGAKYIKTYRVAPSEHGGDGAFIIIT